jgi:hypothetical protein
MVRRVGAARIVMSRHWRTGSDHTVYAWSGKRATLGGGRKVSAGGTKGK